MTDQPLSDRAIQPAVMRGLRLRCPNCGEGKILHSYLKVNETCSHCNLELGRARADDGPAYLTILIVGHLLGFALHIVWTTWRPDPLTMALFMTVFLVGLSLWMLPRMKGLVIAYQWAKRMYGL